MSKLAKELDFEKEIVQHLVDNGYVLRKSSMNPSKSDYNRSLAMDPELLLRFLWNTQKDEMDVLKRLFGENMEETVINTVRNKITQKRSSFIEVLRNGVDISNHHLTLLYKKPATSLNHVAVENYEQNIFSVIPEVWITDSVDKTGNAVPENVGRVDIVTFINGFAFAAFELKYNASGTTSQDAREQYEKDRDPSNPLFAFKTGAVVCFAMDENEVYMTTRLNRNLTQWMPFNMGRGEGINCGAGNPVPEDGEYPVHYMWDDVLTKDSVIELLTKFITVQREQKLNNLTGKIEEKEALIFPRYHQRDAVRKIIADVSVNGTERNYLIQHSAGSGKTKTIMWLAYRLASLHDTDNNPVFNNVIIVTDRVVVDKQLQDAINGFEHQTGYVKTISEEMNSGDLEDALAGNTKIIVTTIQKFLYVYTKGMSSKKFAVIIDEAHQSTSGEDMKKLSSALSEDEYDAQDAMDDALAKTGKRSNISMFAFTATPKAKTLELFGTLNRYGRKQAFHLYSMKQAIEEGFILDVLENYIEYKTYFTIAQTTSDDPLVKSANAKRQIMMFAALNEENIGQKVQIIVEHFRTYVMNELGGNAKAMVVTSSRAEAVRYRKAVQAYLDERGIKDVKALVAFSGKVTLDKDGMPAAIGTEYTEAGMNGIPEKKLPAVFDGDEYNLLLVANKYQVGFDQPKLCAMYILKKLKGVNAVQTLSRLNRTCRPYDKKVVVLDFVNTAAEMEDAFSQYYTTTLLNNTASESQLYDLKDKIRGFYLYDDDDVEKVVKALTDPSGMSGPKRQSLINMTVNRVKSHLAYKPEADQKDFRVKARGYCKNYRFLSLLLPLNDEGLKNEFLFLDELVQYLNTGTSGGIDIKDKVRLFNFKQENQGDHGIKTGHRSDPTITLAIADPQLREDEEKKLSVILDELAEKTGKEYSEDSMRSIMRWFKGRIVSDKEIQDSAKANSFKDFMNFTYHDRTDKILSDNMPNDYELMNALLNNEELCNELFGALAKGVYDMSRGAAE